MKKIWIFLALMLLSLTLFACDKKDVDLTDPKEKLLETLRETYAQNDIYYQVFVRSFADSNGDGIGDLNGITQNLDYFQTLGVTALWLLPINSSNSYHGYDVKDYYDIQSEYGTMEDFQNLVTQAQAKGIKIVIDLVINHTSDQHPWYIEARSSTSNPFRDWYIWQGNSAFESFVGGMKDLNLNNPAVVNEIKHMMQFYLELGVHGFRLDAAKHFFLKPGVVGADLASTLFILDLNRYIKEINPNSFIVSEVFEYNYNFFADYFIGSDSVFNFYAAGQIWDKVGQGNSRYLLVNNLRRAYQEFAKINPDFIDTPFLTNHDLDRLASMGGFSGVNGLLKQKLAATILLTLPGSPFIYYGEELGMKGYRDYTQNGQNVSGYGIAYDEFRRTPFLWGDASKQTTWFPDSQNLNTPNLIEQKTDEHSLFRHYQTLNQLRLNTPALMYGNYFEPFKDNDSNIQGYVRYFEHEGYKQALLVIHNNSSSARTMDLEYLNILYGDLVIEAYGSLILEIDPALIEGYI